MKETTALKIREIQDRVNAVIGDSNLDVGQKEYMLGYIYLDARDYKSNGNLSGESIRDVLEYDEEAIMYTSQALQDIQKQAEKEYSW